MTIPAVTPKQIQAAALVLAKIKTKDVTAANPDEAMAISWAESFAHHGLEFSDLMAGVHNWFADPTRPRDRVLPADIIRMARDVRRDRIERDPAAKRAIEDRIDAKVERHELEVGERPAVESRPVSAAKLEVMRIAQEAAKRGVFRDVDTA